MLSQALILESPNGFLRGLRHLTYSNPFYNYSLIGRTPTRLLGTPPELMPGNAATGQALLAGSINYQGSRHAFTFLKDLPEQINEDWLAYLHGFSWLSNLRCVGTKIARTRAQKLISDWISSYKNWDRLSWRPDILGIRLINWTTHFAFVAIDADQELLKNIYTELGRQSRHLSRTVMQAAPGRYRVLAAKGLIYAGIAVPDCDKYLMQGLEHLEREVGLQVYSDGGHASRNPMLQMGVMRDLVEVRETLSAAHIGIPSWLQISIERMAPMLRAMRLGDGGLALFHEGTSGNPEEIDVLLSRANVRGKKVFAGPDSGYHRLEAGKTVLILDGGLSPVLANNKWGHAGALAFEMSTGKERLIVNCGTTRRLGKDWHQALRSTAAHSTMTVDDVNSAELNQLGGFWRMPANVRCNRREIDGRAVIEASSDGYCQPFDLTHRRIITISDDGLKIQGEDQLTGTGGCSFAVRFHLHPNIQVTLIQHGSAALLKLRRGRGWKLTVPDMILILEDSVYLDGSTHPRRSQQIIVLGELLGRGASVKWLLTRI